MAIVIKCHYIPDDQGRIKYGKGKQIVLTLTDYDSKKKLAKCIKRLQEKDSKSPIYGDELKVSFTDKTKYFKNEDQVILKKLEGNEVIARITIKKYCFKSRKKENKGELIKGVSASLVEMKNV